MKSDQLLEFSEIKQEYIEYSIAELVKVDIFTIRKYLNNAKEQGKELLFYSDNLMADLFKKYCDTELEYIELYQFRLQGLAFAVASRIEIRHEGKIRILKDKNVYE